MPSSGLLDAVAATVPQYSALRLVFLAWTQLLLWQAVYLSVRLASKTVILEPGPESGDAAMDVKGSLLIYSERSGPESQTGLNKQAIKTGSRDECGQESINDGGGDDDEDNDEEQDYDNGDGEDERECPTDELCQGDDNH
ncbi:hypothetical protein J3A83DRAFT_4187913 [Scleroderma citrinum]